MKADQKADAAGNLAAAAAADTAAKPDEARVQAIVDERVAAALAGLTETLQTTLATSPPAATEPPKPDSEPTSVKKKARRRVSFAQKYMGITPNDD